MDPINDAAAAGRAGLAAKLQALEAFAAHSAAAGEAMPPEALEMIGRLREIVVALDGLTSSLHAPIDAGAEPRETPNDRDPNSIRTDASS